MTPASRSYASHPEVAEVVSRAHAKYPALGTTLPDETFEPYLRARITNGVFATHPHAPDLFLAWGVMSQHSAAVSTLEALIEREVRHAVQGRPVAAQFVDEVNQLLLAKLVVAEPGRPPKVTDYSGRGPIGAWLRASALGVALNLTRRQHPTVDTDDVGFDSEDLLIAERTPETAYLRELCRAEFNAAFRQALTTLATRERNLIRLRFLDALSLEELARYFRVHRATVVRWLAEVTSRLLDQTRANLGHHLALDQSEIDSLLRTARSRIDFSLKSLLAEVTSS